MKYFVFILLLCSELLSKEGLSQTTVLKEQLLNGKFHDLYNENHNQENRLFKEPLVNNADRNPRQSVTLMTAILTSTAMYCDCGENSKSCRFDWRGEKKCDCFSGYAEIHGYCEECNCGPYGSCSFKYGQKKCYCISFAFEINGFCVDVGATSSEAATVSSSEITTDFSELSTVDSSTARECNCGPYGLCRFEYGRKQCYCKSFAVEKNGVCIAMETTSENPIIASSTVISSTPHNCYCGSYSYSCYLDSVGKSVCNCFFGYSQLDGWCTECNCGPYGSCRFEFGRKKCNCRSLAVEVNGVCVDIGTSSESTTDSFITSTILSSTEKDICSYNTCVHGKCEIIRNGFRCKCNEGFTGPRCEDKIQIKRNKRDILMILQLLGTLAIFILLFGMFCFLVGILKRYKM